MRRIQILGTSIDIDDMESSVQIIGNAVSAGTRLRIVTANPEMIYLAARDDRLQQAINCADLVLPDGIGVVWAARRQGVKLRERVTGIDLTYRLLEEGNRKGWRFFLLGAKPGVAETAVFKLYKRYPRITFACYHGYFSKEEEIEVISRIKKFSADILLAGLGCPLQEYWLAENSDLAVVSMGIGGTIDVLAGKVKRAPRWVRKIGLEWLYRLGRNPGRIKRQINLPRYVLEVLRQDNNVK